MRTCVVCEKYLVFVMVFLRGIILNLIIDFVDFFSNNFTEIVIHFELEKYPDWQ